MANADRLRARRTAGGFNLSFLDVMSCGLGAVILIFLIIKHNVDAPGSVEADRVLETLESLERRSERLRDELEEIARLNAEEQRLGAELDRRRRAALELLAGIDARMTAERQRSLQLQRSIERKEEALASDVIEVAGAGEEEYLTGLAVGGERIAILVDHSASMTHERLARIFRYKVAPDAEKRGAPKWQRATTAARWLLARVPPGSEVALLAFAEQPLVLGSGGWFRTSRQTDLDAANRALGDLAPAGATDLRAAFEKLTTLTPVPTDVYLITDGLPTESAAGGRCTRGYKVSGKCRLDLFTDAVRVVRDRLPGIRLNVILLPLEGDWDAANAYWIASNSTGGRMIAPAQSWP